MAAWARVKAPWLSATRTVNWSPCTRSADMPISVLLRKERGEIVRSMTVPYEPAPASWDAEEHPMLAGVDPHGNAIFNARQMRRIRLEAEALLAGELTLGQRLALEGVVELCDAGQRPPHRYLWFVGD